MTVLVHFSGPSYSNTAVLEPGADPIEVGRDPKAGVYLPDQDRLISRRHASLQWDEGGVKVTVLSKVNGVTTARGEIQAGESLVLAPGETGQIGRFTFVAEQRAASGDSLFLPTQQAELPGADAGVDAESVAAPLPAFVAAATNPQPVPSAPAAEADPWAAFAKEWVAEAEQKKQAAAPPPASLNRALDDAFSSSTAWRIEDMPVVDPLSSASFQSDKALGVAFAVPGAPAAVRTSVPVQAPVADNAAGMETALRALCRGLGITGPPQWKEKDWEQLGASIRQIVQGLSELASVRAELRKEMRAVERTMVGAKESNPLQDGMATDELLHYLLFMTQGMAGYLPAQRSIDESVNELRAHEYASVAAVRAAIEGALREFDPARLRDTLLQGKRSIGVLDNARLWDLYTSYYQARGEHMPQWLEQVFSRHFMPTYTRETERLRREAQEKAKR